MRRIHSQHFQICQIDEYWRITYVKVSSHDYSSIYAKTPQNVDKYSVFAYVWRINVCVVPPSDKSQGTADFVTRVVSASTKHELLRVVGECRRCSACGPVASRWLWMGKVYACRCSQQNKKDTHKVNLLSDNVSGFQQQHGRVSEQHCVIKFCMCLKKDTVETILLLREMFRNEVSGVSTIKMWHKMF